MEGERPAEMRSSDSSFLKGAFTLTFAAIAAKAVGAVSRIPLYSLLGSEGMGLFQMAYPMYTVLLTVSTSGLSVAISKLMAEKIARGDVAGARLVFRVSLSLLTASGLALCGLLYFAAPWIAQHVARDARATLAIRAISPALLLVSVMSAFRGFFQGLQDMVPTAVSQVLEQLGRLGSMLVLASLLLPRGIHYAAGGATAGAAAGAAAALMYISIVYFRRKRQLDHPSAMERRDKKERYLLEVVRVAVPVSLASVVFGLAELIDLSLVPSRLRASGLGAAESTTLYGRLSGGALPLINLPTVFTGALAVSLVPSVAAASGRRDFTAVSRRVRKALALTYSLALPASLGLYVLAEPIPQLLYGDPEVAVVLRPMSSAVLFLALQQVSTAVLQGLGLLTVPVLNLLCAALVKAVLTWFLVGDPAIGIRGASIATAAYFVTSSLLNIRAVRKQVGGRVQPGPFAAASISAALMAVGTGFVYRTLLVLTGSRTATVLSVLCGMLVYGVLILATGGIGADDVAAIPGAGTFIAGILRRLGRE